MLPSTLTDELDLDTLAVTVARSDGNLDDAARLLHIPADNLLTQIVQNPALPRLIAQYMRTITLLNTYQLLDMVRNSLRDKIDDMPAKEVGTLYTNLLQAVAQLTNNETAPQTNAPSIDIVLQALPHEARIAFRQLLTETTE